jgi:3alpha(or 20beta)-hydroxysteroid dehydrogenase
VVVSTTVYSASKAALANLTKTSAAWLGQYDIRVNSIHPGAHDTEMVRKGFEQVTDPAIRAAILDGIPLKRLGRAAGTGWSPSWPRTRRPTSRVASILLTVRTVISDTSA